MSMRNGMTTRCCTAPELISRLISEQSSIAWRSVASCSIYIVLSFLFFIIRVGRRGTDVGATQERTRWRDERAAIHARREPAAGAGGGLPGGGTGGPAIHARREPAGGPPRPRRGPGARAARWAGAPPPGAAGRSGARAGGPSRRAGGPSRRAARPRGG